MQNNKDTVELIADLKIILVGDTACGKTKLVEWFLLDQYEQRQLSTYALNIFQFKTKVNEREYNIDIWDTAGQDIYKELHPSYFFNADGCIMVFDLTRKQSYTNLNNWHQMLQHFSGNIPTILVGNKLDLKPESATKKYNFSIKNEIPIYFTSSASGINVVRIFTEIIEQAIQYKQSGQRQNYIKDVIDILDEDLFDN